MFILKIELKLYLGSVQYAMLLIFYGSIGVILFIFLTAIDWGQSGRGAACWRHSRTCLSVAQTVIRQPASHRCSSMLQVASGDNRPCSRQTEGSGLSPSLCRCFRTVVVISVVVISSVWLLSSLSTRRWGNDHRLLFVTAASSSSPFSVVSSSRPTCPLSVLRVVSRMRGPLLGRAAVLYALLALSISLAGKEMLRAMIAAFMGLWSCAS